MKNTQFIFTAIVLIISNISGMAQTKKMMTQNPDASKNLNLISEKDSNEVHVFAEWKVKEGQLENVLNELKIVREKSIKESGNLFYKIHRGRSEPNIIILFEGYSDENALEEHKKSTYYQECVLKKIVPLLANRKVVVTIAFHF